MTKKGYVKKPTKPIEEHSSSATAVHESESFRPMEQKELQDLVSKLKWETFCTHLRTYSPSLVRDFYANLYDHELEFIFVRKGLIPWDATKINELYNTKVDADKHSEFIEDITDDKRDLLVTDLCAQGVLWTGSHQKNYTMHRCFLTLQSQIWFYFLNCRLLPSTHSTTINLDRMCLIHFIVKGRKIDVGTILHQEIADWAVR
ncbi:hypothetical protein V6Z11_D13G095500 [Gossypium hirsutum]